MTTAPRPSHGASAPDDGERSLFAAMLRLRRFEEKAGMLYALGTLGTPCPLGIGQEGAIAAVASAVRPNDIVVALSASPAVELAFGTPPSQAFQQLLPAHVPDEPRQALVRLPGEALRRMSCDAALALAAGRPEPVVLVVTDVDTMVAAVKQLPDRTLPLLILPSDRTPASWSDLAPLSVRECDGADALGLCETIAAARDGLAAGHAAVALAILTPPYAGHARDAARRAPARREGADPIAISRRRLLAGGRFDETGLTALEATIRDEIAAAGRAIAMACT